MHRSFGLRTVTLVAAWLVFAAAATAQIDILTGKPLSGSIGGAADEGPFQVTAEILPAKGKEPAQLWITADIQPGWHIFSITQKDGGPSRTKIQLDRTADYKTLGDLMPDPIPTRHAEPLWNNLEVEEHADKVTWHVPIAITAGVDLSQLVITGKVVAQACNAGSCLPPKGIPFKAMLATSSPAKLPKGTEFAADSPPNHRVEDDPLPGSLLDLPALGGDAGTFANPKIHAVVRGTFEPAVVVPGGKALLTLTAEPAVGFHVYALEKSDPEKLGSGKPTLIIVQQPDQFTIHKPLASAAPHVEAASGEKSYDEPIHWTIEIDVPADAKPGQYPIAGMMGYQTCSGKNCDPPAAVRFAGKLVVGTSQQGGQLPLTFTLAKYGEVAKAAASAPALPEASDVAATPTSGNKPAVATAPPASLGTMILFSLLGGMILNLMPCVLPVIGLKILSFVEQAHKHRSQVLMLNIWYTLGLLSVFMILATLAVFMNLSWGTQFQRAEFNVAMSAIVFVMALSFLGVWEIPLPSFVGSREANQLASREGAGGAFFKGMLTTVLATPCSGPFLGPVFGFTVTQPPAITYLIFGCIGLGMASPYLLIGAFPRLIRFLPKPGAWMDTFKQMMAFVLLFTVVYMFTILNRDYLVPTFALLVGLWAGCWWIGRVPLYEGWNKIARAWVAGSVFAMIIGAASFHFLLPTPALLPWRPYSPGTLAKLTSEGNTVMVDFTANWCPTCKVNFHTAIDTPAVLDVVQNNGVVPLLADWTNESEEIRQALNELGSDSIPFLVIYPASDPEKPIILRDLVSLAQVLEALKSAGPSADKAKNSATAMATP